MHITITEQDYKHLTTTERQHRKYKLYLQCKKEQLKFYISKNENEFGSQCTTDDLVRLKQELKEIEELLA